MTLLLRMLKNLEDTTIRHGLDLEVEFLMAVKPPNTFSSKIGAMVKHCSEDEVETIFTIQ